MADGGLGMHGASTAAPVSGLLGRTADFEALSVVVPVFNSERTLAPLVERLGVVLGACVQSFEIILVDDGSFGGSWDVITGLAHD